MTQTEVSPGSAEINRYWPHRGGSFTELLASQPEEAPLPSPEPDEVIARVEAVSICSSDIKIVRMGSDHPLFANAAGVIDTVLGHEVCLRVHAVGREHAGRFRPGQRLGLQPAMWIKGERRIIGMDTPGGFAQYLRLGSEALASYVFDVPEHLRAAEIALLEPYGCIENAWRPNTRQTLLVGGRALVVVGADGAGFSLPRAPDWGEVVVVGIAPAFVEDFRQASSLEEVQGTFDDIVALGELSADVLGRLCDLMAVGGLLLQGRRGASPGPVAVDPARVHYDRLSFLGTRSADLSEAFEPSRQRFDARRDGVALVHGAGGAMGRIHVHRLLQMENGPRTVIASSRKGQRLADLEADFATVAQAVNREFIVADSRTLPETIARFAPDGLDDAVVVAPNAQAVADAAGWLAPDGLLSIFAGFPYGQKLYLHLAAVALAGFRLTGSTGCSVDDMKNVLRRVVSGQLDLSANIAAVAGLDMLPRALEAVASGEVSGKIVLYPHRPTMPLTPLAGQWSRNDENGITG